MEADVKGKGRAGRCMVYDEEEAGAESLGCTSIKHITRAESRFSID